MKTATKKAEDKPTLYDGNAVQRIPLEITEGGERFETAHKVAPVTDAIFLEFVDQPDYGEGASERGSDTDYAEHIQNELKKALTWLWKKIVKSIENIEVDDDSDFRDAIDAAEVEAVVSAVLNVGIVRPVALTTAARSLSAKATVAIRTDALFNGKITQQTHTLHRKTDEHRKRYDLIFSNDAKSSDRARRKGELYDSLVVKTEGFKGKVPLRFKTQVIDYHFEDTVSLKK